MSKEFNKGGGVREILEKTRGNLSDLDRKRFKAQAHGLSRVDKKLLFEQISILSNLQFEMEGAVNGNIRPLLDAEKLAEEIRTAQETAEESGEIDKLDLITSFGIFDGGKSLVTLFRRPIPSNP